MNRQARRPYRAEAMRIRNALSTHADAIHHAITPGSLDYQDRMNLERAEWWRGRRRWLEKRLRITREPFWVEGKTVALWCRARQRIWDGIELNHLWTGGGPDRHGRKNLPREYPLLRWHHDDWPTPEQVIAKGAPESARRKTPSHPLASARLTLFRRGTAWLAHRWRRLFGGGKPDVTDILHFQV